MGMANWWYRPPGLHNLGAENGFKRYEIDESERGVWFSWKKVRYTPSAHPISIERTSSFFSGGGKPILPPQFWSPGGRYHRFAIPMSRMTGNQKAAQCYNAFKGMGAAAASDSPGIRSSPPVVAVPGAATPSWHSNRQPRRTRAALAGWNCPARSVNLVCFNAGGYPKPTCGSTCSKSAPGAKYVPNQIR